MPTNPTTDSQSPNCLDLRLLQNIPRLRNPDRDAVRASSYEAWQLRCRARKAAQMISGVDFELARTPTMPYDGYTLRRL